MADQKIDRGAAAKATAWFARLIHARISSDKSDETAARRELDQLGVTVRFRRDAKGGSR